MPKYKDTLVGKPSDLHKALEAGHTKLAEQIHKDTTLRAKECFGANDYAWFMERVKQ